jgi:hypothetical protein
LNFIHNLAEGRQTNKWELFEGLLGEEGGDKRRDLINRMFTFNIGKIIVRKHVKLHGLGILISTVSARPPGMTCANLVRGLGLGNPTIKNNWRYGGNL